MCETLKIKKYKHASSTLEKKTIFYIKPMISIYEERRTKPFKYSIEHPILHDVGHEHPIILKYLSA
jgi:transposase